MAERTELHSRNKHNGQYDFPKLISNYPALDKFVSLNKYGTLSIDFFNPKAVKALNKALLISYYGIELWDVPTNYLCPPIPGRADYIHYIADLIGVNSVNNNVNSNNSTNSRNSNNTVNCLDIGVGANCIYPIIGCAEYGWKFVGTDVDPVSLENAQKIVDANSILKNNVELREQRDNKAILNGVILADDYFDVVICNPPFHTSKDEAERSTLRKLTNLKGKKQTTASLNFGGVANELWCDGGELRFLLDMISESCRYKKSVKWFTSLVSKEENLPKLYSKLHSVDIQEYRTINMKQGSKSSRILAWRF